MARLIDADRLLRDPYFQEHRWPESHLIRMAVGEQRTVDAVEVVRCKDCKYMYERMSVCTKVKVRGEILHIRVEPDDFCSCGERRTDD